VSGFDSQVWGHRHKAEEIEAAGATLLYLPPYSPDLNPIATPEMFKREPNPL
jgi:transposase